MSAPNPRRIGVFGGTFDPIHNTHLAVARAAQRVASLDQVLFVVAARPPHKQAQSAASPEQRLALLSAAVEEEPDFYACDLELHRSGPSYTADTLRQLCEQFPEDKLFLIVGLDSLLDFPQWRNPEGILVMSDLLVVSRPEPGAAVPSILDGHYEMIPFEESGLSSTQIRTSVAKQEPIHDLVPAAVESIIHTQGLYSDSISNSAR